MYRDLHRRISLSFTLIVLSLLVASGIAYIAADLYAAGTLVDRGLERRTANVLRRIERAGSLATFELGDEESGDVMLLGPNGDLLAGQRLPDIQGVPAPGFSQVRSLRGAYRVYAARVRAGPAAGGTLLIEQPVRADIGDLGEKALVLVAVIAVVSVFTYALGVMFARRSLRPIRENMERLEQFTADAGHELRTPLAAASASLDAGLRTGELEPAAVEARSEVMRAGLLVDRLLELAHMGRLTLEPQETDLSTLVRASVERQMRVAESRGISFKEQITPVVLSCDAILMSRLIDNLIDNAVKFASPGTTITVNLSDAGLTVADVGEPLPGPDVDALFEPFVQGDASRSSKGHGLGLALVKRVADLHGWTVQADSQDGKTVFTVRFRGGRRAL